MAFYILSFFIRPFIRSSLLTIQLRILSLTLCVVWGFGSRIAGFKTQGNVSQQRSPLKLPSCHIHLWWSQRVDIQSHGQKNQCNRTRVIIRRRPGRDKKMEDKQINLCTSGPSSAVQHNLGCLAPEGPEDFSVRLVRPEFRSSVGISHLSVSFWFSLLPRSRGSTRPESEHRVGAGEAGGDGGSDRENTQKIDGGGGAMMGGIREGEEEWGRVLVQSAQ